MWRWNRRAGGPSGPLPASVVTKWYAKTGNHAVMPRPLPGMLPPDTAPPPPALRRGELWTLRDPLQ